MLLSLVEKSPFQTYPLRTSFCWHTQPQPGLLPTKSHWCWLPRVPETAMGLSPSALPKSQIPELRYRHFADWERRAKRSAWICLHSKWMVKIWTKPRHSYASVSAAKTRCFNEKQQDKHIYLFTIILAPANKPEKIAIFYLYFKFNTLDLCFKTCNSENSPTERRSHAMPRLVVCPWKTLLTHYYIKEHKKWYKSDSKCLSTLVYFAVVSFDLYHCIKCLWYLRLLMQQ